MFTANPSCKIAVLVFFVIFLPSTLLAQEQLIFVAARDTFARNVHTNEVIILYAGDIITTNANVTYGQITHHFEMNDYLETRNHLVIIFSERSNTFMTFAKDFLPANTSDIFGEDIFIDFPLEYPEPQIMPVTGFPIGIGDADKMWVASYSRDILMAKNRYILLEMFPALVWLNDHGFFWYEHSSPNIRSVRAMFYNSVISMGLGTHLAVRNIVKTYFGYMVECVISTNDSIFSFGRVFPESMLWETHAPGDSITLFLHIDGDYMNIYVNSQDMFLGTFIRVGREFIAQYQSLIRTNTADLTNVQWPRRADGSMSPSHRRSE